MSLKNVGHARSEAHGDKNTQEIRTEFSEAKGEEEPLAGGRCSSSWPMTSHS
jgi:hypothetical protein